MAGVRRRRSSSGSRKWSRRRFYVMTGLLVSAVALLAVPLITQVLESMMSFDPGLKEFTRVDAAKSRGLTALFTGTEAYLSIAFLVLCVLFFMQSRKD
jgi:hypothetical protein